ncbi:MAG TPA: RluA family pseudouridine synthase [Candidatus Cloacimonadota bacterium]|nr:RluA family pseudouridine synthase [Candidatus Cloacimonadota bacterium]HPS39004.1 RluA family pseudouridine synthase [Candidatus Cloacimonadota bacterium]
MNQKIKVVYDREDQLRLDKYLVDLRIQELYSRSFIEKLIADDRILVNLIPVKKSYMLSNGDQIDLNMPEPEPTEIIPQNIPLDILYEDEDLAVINKPAGMIVHPGFGNPDNTLVNAIVYHFGNNLSSGKEINRPGIVHRLDRGTSGLMIIAKNDIAQSLISEMFARREIKKTYLAITTGVPDPPEDAIETYITRSISNPRKNCVADEGKWALTYYKTIRLYHFFSIVKVKLETGRMHQIRVHFADRNIPILGDLLYNTRRQVHNVVPENMKRKVTELLTTHLLRQALHAWRLEFTHPVSGKDIDIQAPLPDDIAYTISWLDKNFGIDEIPVSIETLLENNINW